MIVYRLFGGAASSGHGCASGGRHLVHGHERRLGRTPCCGNTPCQSWASQPSPIGQNVIAHHESCKRLQPRVQRGEEGCANREIGKFLSMGRFFKQTDLIIRDHRGSNPNITMNMKLDVMTLYYLVSTISPPANARPVPTITIDPVLPVIIRGNSSWASPSIH